MHEIGAPRSKFESLGGAQTVGLRQWGSDSGAQTVGLRQWGSDSGAQTVGLRQCRRGGVAWVLLPVKAQTAERS
jgi:hypothetical protein